MEGELIFFMQLIMNTNFEFYHGFGHMISFFWMLWDKIQFFELRA